MKKIFCLFTILLSLTTCDLNSSSSNENNLKLYDADFIYQEEITFFINEYYKLTYDGIKHVIEDNSIVEYDEEKQKLHALKEGTTKVKVIKDNGEYDECILNVITKDKIKSIEDVYQMDDYYNFEVLYVIENNDGIVRYVYDGYKNDISKPIPWFEEPRLYLKEEVWNDESSEYEILTFKDNTISPKELKYGDVIICHYNMNHSYIYLNPCQWKVYNLFYTGITTNQEILVN